MAESISFLPIYQFVIIVLMVIGIMRVLKWKKIFDDSFQPVIDKIVTELAVPAVIFSAFATLEFSPYTLYPSAILFLTLILALIVAWIICRLCRFPPKTTGTLVMVSGFGSTATMANPLLINYFSAQPVLIQKGLTIGMLGVAFPFFTLGVIIASYYGAKGSGHDVRIADTLREFLATPIFISFILGIFVAFVLAHFQTPGAAVFIDIFTHFFTIINLSVNLLLWIAIGLMIRRISAKYFLPLFGMVIGIKLVFEPVIASFFAVSAGLPLPLQQILLLESAVPSGAIAAVLASRYGCESSLAGWMVVGTFIVSLVTIPLMFLIFPA
jgi:malate permease and related proteins